MCCFRLHFSDLMCYFFKRIKNLLQFTFEKNNLLCKKREKITCREEKSQPPWISNGPSLTNSGRLHVTKSPKKNNKNKISLLI